jgi:hypothetical protein
LSHIAEELAFYRQSGLAPKQNVGSATISDPKVSQSFLDYAQPNFLRFNQYLNNTETQSALGVDDADDDLQTRGATWSYLRYVADQRFAPPENQYWYKLVNSNLTGMPNLLDVVGSDARLLMRDWALSVLMDDRAPGVPAKYQQPSWNLRQVASSYPPSTKALLNNATSNITLSAGGVSYDRFVIAAGGEAYVSASGILGTALPRGVLLALVRTK